MPRFNINATAIFAIVAVGIVGFFILFKRRAFDVTSQDNIVAGPLNRLIAGATMVQGDTLGTSINRGVENAKNVIADALAKVRPGENLPTYWDKTQEWKTCMAFKRSRGKVSARCQTVINKDAPRDRSLFVDFT